VTSIQNVLASGVKDGKRSDTRIYGTNGQLRRNYQRGVNIVKQKNKRTRKVVKK
jgi:hypothetical protein